MGCRVLGLSSKVLGLGKLDLGSVLVGLKA